MITELRRIGKYELLQCLGHNGRGEIWKAYDTERQRSVACKIFYADLQADSNYMTEFVHNMQVIASLHQPKIVQIYNVEVLPSSKLQGGSSYWSVPRRRSVDLR
jgi:eukaryotic-like serine/threonine-protein kinase